jgi:nitrogenase molybdenum-iron protein NifN
MSLPIGIRATDRLADRLSALTGRPCPEPHVSERLRLIDAYVDGHKHVSGAKAVVYGELDLVVGLAGFLAEVGIRPVLCASGASSARLGAALESVIEDDDYYPEVVEQDVDFVQIETIAADLRPDIIVGNSKGYGMSRRLRIPLVRTGFPIHDRFGGQRLRHVGYRGATELFDRIVNALVEAKQDQNPVGYMYM